MNSWVNSRIFGFENPACHAQDKTEWVASKAVLKKTKSRILVVTCFFFLAYASIIGRMTHLTLAAHGEGATRESTITSADLGVSNTRRADVLDRNGKLLATSLKTRSLYADPKYIMDAAEATRKLMTVFPEFKYDDVYAKLSSKRRFVWLKRNLTPKQIYAANALGLPGIDFLEETRRIYPYGALTAHVVGYADVDGKGLSGVERGMNDALRHSDAPLQTTIDVRLQHILQRELKKSIEDFTALGGAGMIMDAKNGEIYAMVSAPDFNPHDPGHISDVQRFNRITLGAYEMGSTFKTFTMAATLDTMHTPLSKKYDATHPLYRGGFFIHDSHPKARWMTIPEIFMYSSNIGTALIAEEMGTARMKKLYQDLGFFDKPSIEIKEVARPILPNPWRDMSTLTASYGHGIAVTPLHLAGAVAAIVNGGTRVHPTLLKRSQDSYQGQESERIISQETSETMRKLLRIVVSDGTGSKANVPGYRVGGKTGTAEKTLGKGYNNNAQIASFVAAFPMDDPQYIVLIMVDEPKGNKKSYGFATAGWVAAPYAGNIIRDAAPLLGVAPKYDTQLPVIKASLGLTPPQVSMQPHIQSNTHSQGGRLASY